MYSILIKGSTSMYSYATNADGTTFAGDAEAVRTKLSELGQTKPLGNLVVVHNVTLSADFTLEDVA